VACGLRSLFVGFETLDVEGLRAQGKRQNLGRDYVAAVRRLHDLGVMVNASFVFGFDEDDPSVFDRTVEWAIAQGVETATFHVLTPYPGTALFRAMEAAGRLLHRDWDLYDTRHAVFRPARMTPDELEEGYLRAGRDFYRWGSILRGAAAQPDLASGLRHAAYAIGWKKCEPVWDLLIRARRVSRALPLLERVLSGARASPGSPSGQGAADGAAPGASDAPQREQLRQPGSTACRHWGQAVRTAVPQLAQKAWPFRASVAQDGQGTGIGSRRMKYRMTPTAEGTKTARSVHIT
jgi:hypothetical protein